MSLSSRYKTPRSDVLSLADDEEEGEGEGNVIVEEKKNLDDVNKKTHWQELEEKEVVIVKGLPPMYYGLNLVFLLRDGYL